MSPEKETFVGLALEGRVGLEEIDDFVDRWHDDPAAEGTLAEYLGFTDAEYALWVESPGALERILIARKNGRPEGPTPRALGPTAK
jgi:hypothetical protein